MESEVIVNVQGTNVVEFGRKVAAIRRLAEETVEDPVNVLGSDDPPDDPPAARPSGLIDVGETSGKRGEEVAVEIRGHADVPVMGVAMAIGFEPLELEFTHAAWGPLLGEGHQIAAAARDRDHRSVGRAGPHVMLVMVQSTKPGPVGSTLDPVLLPQGSLLVTLFFKITERARVGKSLPLLNRTMLFGEPRVMTMFATDHKKHRGGVMPELGDGAIVVTG